jgi:hypothetical protein
MCILLALASAPSWACSSVDTGSPVATNDAGGGTPSSDDAAGSGNDAGGGTPSSDDAAGSGSSDAQGSGPYGRRSHGLFLGPITSHASLVYDAKGGLHVVGVASGGLSYGHCASSCDQGTSWVYADLVGSGMSGVLAVDGQGHPRVLSISTISGVATYFECNDDDCGSWSRWTTTAIPVFKFTPGLYYTWGDPVNGQYFAVSPQGGAALAYKDIKRGLVYSSCTSSCANAANWQETVPVSTPMDTDFAWASLAMDAAGRPRLAFNYYDPKSKKIVLGFAACDAGCASASGWSSVIPGAQAGERLFIDAQGRPRISGRGGYYWCDDNCAADKSNWQGPVTIPELCDALDGQGNLRCVKVSDPNVSYTACIGGCTSSSPVWNETLLPYADMDADPTAAGLAGDHWGGAEAPFGGVTLALDAAGNAAVAFNAARWPLVMNDHPDKESVFMWLVPSIPDNPDSPGDAGGPANDGGGSVPYDAGVPDGGPEPICQALATAACNTCCANNHVAGVEAFAQQLRACACGSPGVCRTACATEFCGSGKTTTGDACDTCLKDSLVPAAGGQCLGQVTATCEQNPACTAYVSCVKGCK